MSGVSAFEDHADRYETWFEKNPLAYQSELLAIRALLPKGKALEVGVGSGLFAAPLGIKYGVDPSRAMRDRARERGITVVRGVAEALPFAGAEFEAALMVTTVCFLDDIDTAFYEAFRVLKPGGSFLVAFIDKKSLIGRSYELRKDQSVFYKDATFYAVPDLLSHLARAGFRDFDFRQTLFGPVSEMLAPDPIREGHGEGSFVVIKALK